MWMRGTMVITKEAGRPPVCECRREESPSSTGQDAR